MTDTMNRRCRCGVYESAHLEGRGCQHYRRASDVRLWLQDHSPVRHVAGRIWLALPSGWRWRIIGWFDRPGVCWCDLVDAAHKPDACPEDFRAPHGCLCDVPLPTDADAPRPGWCYCPPEKVTHRKGRA